MDAPRVLLVDGVWRDREALTRHAGRAAETLVVRSPEAESPAARSRLGAESALSRPSKPDTRGMTSQQALRISVEKALSGTSSPRSIAAVRSAKWHLSTLASNAQITELRALAGQALRGSSAWPCV